MDHLKKCWLPENKHRWRCEIFPPPPRLPLLLLLLLLLLLFLLLLLLLLLLILLLLIHLLLLLVPQADVILVVTCAIRENAENKVWLRLNHFRNLKLKRKSRGSDNPPLRVGVLGQTGMT